MQLSRRKSEQRALQDIESWKPVYISVLIKPCQSAASLSFKAIRIFELIFAFKPWNILNQKERRYSNAKKVHPLPTWKIFASDAVHRTHKPYCPVASPLQKVMV
jgi:hypothetical protein